MDVGFKHSDVDDISGADSAKMFILSTFRKINAITSAIASNFGGGDIGGIVDGGQTDDGAPILEFDAG